MTLPNYIAMENLEKFIIEAKANGWAGAEPGGKKLLSSKLGSYDISFDSGDYHYHDSFVGLSDFCGQEHVTYNEVPVWSLVYYGYLLKPKEFTGKQIVAVLKEALGAMYSEGRFLGGFTYKTQDGLEYRDPTLAIFKDSMELRKSILRASPFTN